MTAAPVNVSAALASFDETYSPRIVARMNDYEVRVAHTKGEHVWHVHEDTDEFSWSSTASSMWPSAMLTAARPPSRCVRATCSSCRKVQSTSLHHPAPRFSCSSRRAHPAQVTGMKDQSRPMSTALPAMSSTNTVPDQARAGRGHKGSPDYLPGSCRGARLRTPRSAGPARTRRGRPRRQAAGAGPARRHTPAARRCRRGPEQRRPAGSRHRATPATLAVYPSRDPRHAAHDLCPPFLTL